MKAVNLSDTAEYISPEAICARLMRLGSQAPWAALQAITAILEYGEGKHSDNPLKWREQTFQAHYQHACHHEQKHQAKLGDHHVKHWAIRVLMALEKELERRAATNQE